MSSFSFVSSSCCGQIGFLGRSAETARTTSERKGHVRAERIVGFRPQFSAAEQDAGRKRDTIGLEPVLLYGTWPWNTPLSQAPAFHAAEAHHQTLGVHVSLARSAVMLWRGCVIKKPQTSLGQISNPIRGWHVKWRYTSQTRATQQSRLPLPQNLVARKAGAAKDAAPMPSASPCEARTQSNRSLCLNPQESIP